MKKSSISSVISRVSKKMFMEFKMGWRKDVWWRFRVPSIIVRILFRIIEKENCGIYVMQEDWDNLVVLDACAYNVFAETNWIKGTLEKKNSRGSHTWMFFQENFKDYYADTIYISSNPFIWEFRDYFYRVAYIAPKEEIETYGTVLPETVLKQALEVSNKYPNKRLIIHFLQPHYPFIGETKIGNDKIKNTNPFYLLGKGEIEEADLRRAYSDNLKRALPYVEKLVNEIPGKTIITSDHGEAFGAWARPFPIRIYGHSGPRIKELVEIPWLVIEKEPRKRIIADESKETPKDIYYENEVRKHLQSLGYI